MDFQARAKTIDLAAYANWSAVLSTSTVALRLQGMRISANAFELLGAIPATGRLLTRTDDAVGAPPVALLGYASWHRDFAGDPGIVGTPCALASVRAAALSPICRI